MRHEAWSNFRKARAGKIWGTRDPSWRADFSDPGREGLESGSSTGLTHLWVVLEFALKIIGKTQSHRVHSSGRY